MSNKTPTPVEEDDWPDNNNTINFNPSTKCNIITDNTPPDTPPHSVIKNESTQLPPPPPTTITTTTVTQEQQSSSSITTSTSTQQQQSPKTDIKIESTNSIPLNTSTESIDSNIGETPQVLSLKTLSGNQVKSIIVSTLPTQRISIKSGTKSRLSQMTESQIIDIIKQYL